MKILLNSKSLFITIFSVYFINLLLFTFPTYSLNTSFGVPLGKKIYLNWEGIVYNSNEIISGYSIYKSLKQGVYLEKPISQTNAKVKFYIDESVQPNQTYFYKITPIFANGITEGVSNEVSVIMPNFGNIKKIILKDKDPYLYVDNIKSLIDKSRTATYVIVNNRAMVPLRSILETIGADVSWIGQEKLVLIAYKNLNLKLWINQNKIQVNSNIINTPVAPMLINNMTYIPLSSTFENLYLKAEWNTDRTITLTNLLNYTNSSVIIPTTISTPIPVVKNLISFERKISSQSELVKITDGKLTYGKYLNRGESGSLNIIPDFSFSGYKGGGIKIPSPSTTIELLPSDGDNSIVIQDAINQISQNTLDSYGFRGVILLKKGTYLLNSPLNITSTGIVIRGEGFSESGTILKANFQSQDALISITGSLITTPYTETQTSIINETVPVGANSFEVENASNLKPGDLIHVVKTPNDLWIQTLNMFTYGWKSKDYIQKYERKIIRIDSNIITVDNPLVDNIVKNYGGGYIVKIEKSGIVENCAVENLRLDTIYTNEFDENHAWTGVEFQSVENSWVKDVISQHFSYSCVNLGENSKYNTVQDCAMLDPISLIDGSKRYSFNIGSNSSCNLIQRCFTRSGRHDFVTGSRVGGPNVFLDSLSENANADTGTHHRWATGVLFDNIKTNALRVENRKDSGSGHGWSGAQVLFWNCEGNTIVADAPPMAMNYSVGTIANKIEGTWGPEEPAGIFESPGFHVPIRSLYLEQLRDRLGNTAVENITTISQRNQSLFEELRIKFY